MQTGKLREEWMRRLLARVSRQDDSVSLGPAFGEDAAVLENVKSEIIVASDPVTFAADNIGWYALHINANDIAASGGIPRWFLADILLPRSVSEADVEDVFAQIASACAELSVSVIGGHTEITPALSRPIVCGTMLGTAAQCGVVRSAGAHVGDALILTGGVCIEATALLAREKRDETRAVLGEAAWNRAAAFLRNPGLSIVKHARIACATVAVHAMHDPTEGGVYMGIYELARASEIGVVIEEERIPVYPESARLCAHFSIDPYRALASGALLICVAQEDVAPLLAAYKVAGIHARKIGGMIPRGFFVKRNGLKYPLLPNERDEIANLFSGRD